MTATLEEQIAALDEIAVNYCRDIAKIQDDEQMGTYWMQTAEGWMMVIGLRRAQLKSARRYHGMVLVA